MSEVMEEMSTEKKGLPKRRLHSKGDRVKKRFPSFWANLKEYFIEYTRHTTLNGFPYMGDQSRSLFERLIWLIIMCLSVYAGTLQIIDAYDKWTTSPVIVSFAKNSIPVYRIPFPAITICPEMKSKQRIFNFTEVYHKVKTYGGERNWKIWHCCAIITYTPLEISQRTLMWPTFLQRSPRLFERPYGCANGPTCKNPLTTALTDEGICFTANMLDWDEIYTNEVFHNKKILERGRKSHGWTLENGYLPGTGSNTFPRRALSAGLKAGLNIALRAFEQDLDYLCTGPVQGFKILLHHPGEVPRVSMQFYRVPLNQEIILTIKPDMMTASLNLRGYDPLKRGCYFEGERYLRFFKTYTAQSCQVECLTNLTLHLCRCVAFYMPYTEATKICGSGNIKCLQDAQVEMLSGKHGNCGCLPACTSLTYNAEVTQADFNFAEVFQGYKENVSHLAGIRISRIVMFFKEMQFITTERSELYDVVDFVATCGGLMGFFTGCSYISFIEIFHFLSLRLFFNLYSFGIHYWSGSEKLLSNAVYDH